MTKNLAIYIFLFVIGLGGANAQTSPVSDIVVDTKLNYDWSEFLVSKLRKIFIKNNLPDPFMMKLEEPLVVMESVVETHFNDESIKFLKDLSQLIGMDLHKGQSKVVIEGFEYDVSSFKLGLHSLERRDEDELVISTNISASSLDVRADAVILSLVIPSKDPKKVTSIDIKIMRPVIRARVDKLLDFSANLSINDVGNGFKFSIPDANFDDMAALLLTNPKGIYLNFRDIIIPEVKLRVGNKVLELDQAKVKEIFNNNQRSVKNIFLSMLASQLKKGMGTSLLKIIENYTLKKGYFYDSAKIASFFKINSFNSDQDRNNLEMDITSDFCSPTGYQAVGNDCLVNKVTQPRESRISEIANRKSLAHVKSLIDSGEANLVASISENYVNKLLATSYDSGHWDEELNSIGVELGPNKVFVRMDEKGEFATLFMDVVYKPKFIQGIAMGDRTIRFPLVVKVFLRIENFNKIPNFVIHFGEIALDDNTLLHGREDVGLLSNIHKLRLKNRILREIKSKVTQMQGKDILSLPYSELEGFGLENVDFQSDGLGRMNALLRLKDFAN